MRELLVVQNSVPGHFLRGQGDALGGGLIKYGSAHARRNNGTMGATNDVLAITDGNDVAYLGSWVLAKHQRSGEWWQIASTTCWRTSLANGCPGTGPVARSQGFFAANLARPGAAEAFMRSASEMWLKPSLRSSSVGLPSPPIRL